MKDKVSILLVVSQVTLTALLLRKHLAKRKSKANDMAIMYFKAAVTELEYKGKADIDLAIAAIKTGKKYLEMMVPKKRLKKFPSGGILLPLDQNNLEEEYVIKK